MLVLNTAQSNTLGSSLGGTGTFSLQGGGSLNLTGNSSGFSGPPSSAMPALASTAAWAATCSSAGRHVSGTGTIVGHLFNGGIVAPGNSTGTLDVAGNFSHAGGVFMPPR